MLSLFLAAIKNPKAIGYGLLVTAAFSAGVYVRGQWDASTLKSALASQQEALVKQCEDSKKITEEVSREYQSKISDLSKRVAAYKLRKPPACVHVTNTTSGNDGSPRGGLVGTDAVNSESLTDYAELAEGYRLRLISCQNFVRLERK